jgi:HlyD family secretion protein
MRSVKKKIIVTAILAVLVFLVVLISRKGCGGGSSIEYTYEKITMGDISKSISATGKLDLFETVVVPAGLNGVVSKLIVDYNNFVKAGDLIAVIDSWEADNNLANYTETFKRTKLELESTKDVYDSKKRLLEDKLISPKEVDEARRSFERSQTVYNQTKMQYDSYVGAVNAKKIYAPVSGMILQRGVEPKQNVSAGTMLYTIAPNMKKLKLILNVDEADIGNVKTGQKVSFSVSAFPDKIFNGTLTQVRMNPVMVEAGQTGAKVVTYESMVECDNSDMLLRPGMTVSAMINIDSRKDVVRAPNAAFMTAPVPDESSPEKKFIWKKVKSGGTADLPMVKVEVQTGLNGDDYTEIVSGDIKVGDKALVGMHKKQGLKVPNAK